LGIPDRPIKALSTMKSEINTALTVMNPLRLRLSSR
jgi:hypothetical protein